MFNEFALVLDREARPVVRELAARGILGGVSLGRLYPGEEGLERGLVVAVTETATRNDIDAFAATLGEILDDQ
jgi:glycine dehydrogenase subunit 1